MLRSMYAAVSGMQAFETKLDVVGNNIANVNTTGFKASRVDFSDLMSQVMSGATAPTASASSTTGLGGSNPMQVGLGVQVAATPLLFTQGADENTGNPLDCAINGDGFFIVSPDGQTTDLYYTRAGNFTVDGAGNLMLNGMRVMGFSASSSGGTGSPSLVPINLNALLSSAGGGGSGSGGSSTPTQLGAADLTIGSDGSLTVTLPDGSTQTVGYIALQRFTNPQGLEKVGNSLYANTVNAGMMSQPVKPRDGGAGELAPGMLEMSNVDLTREFTEMIIAQRGFDANSKVIGTDNAILNDIVNLKNS